MGNTDSRRAEDSRHNQNVRWHSNRGAKDSKMKPRIRLTLCISSIPLLLMTTVPVLAQQTAVLSKQEFQGVSRSGQALATALLNPAFGDEKLAEFETAFDVELQALVTANLRGDDAATLVNLYRVARQKYAKFSIERSAARIASQLGRHDRGPEQTARASFIESIHQASAFLGGAADTQQAAVSRSQADNVLRVERLELVDGQGSVRARIALIDASPVVALYDKMGTLRMRLTVTEERGAELTLFDATGQPLPTDPPRPKAGSGR